MAFSDVIRWATGSDGRRDWVFVGFLTFAVVVGSHTAVQRVRLGRALRAAHLCFAAADAECASKALEDARSLAPDALRVRIAGLELDLLVGDTNKAKAGLAALSTEETSKRLDAAARGDVLLLQGDVAAAEGSVELAREHYAAATQLVDSPSLVQPRLERVASREREDAAKVEAIFSDFQRLFDAARTRNNDAVSLRARDLSQRVAKLSNRDAQVKLSLAITALERAAGVYRSNGAGHSNLILYPGSKPTPPTRAESYSDASFERQKAAYERALAAYEKRREALERSDMERSAAASKTAAQNLAEAQALAGEARDLLEKPGAEPR